MINQNTQAIIKKKNSTLIGLFKQNKKNNENDMDYLKILLITLDSLSRLTFIKIKVMFLNK